MSAEGSSTVRCGAFSRGRSMAGAMLVSWAMLAGKRRTNFVQW